MCLISYLYLDNGFNFYPYLDNSIIVHPHLDSSIIFYPHLWINIFSCFCATLTTIIQIKNNLTFRVTFTVSDQGRFSTYVHTYIHRTGVSSPPSRNYRCIGLVKSGFHGLSDTTQVCRWTIRFQIIHYDKTNTN